MTPPPHHTRHEPSRVKVALPPVSHKAVSEPATGLLLKPRTMSTIDQAHMSAGDRDRVGFDQDEAAEALLRP